MRKMIPISNKNEILLDPREEGYFSLSSLGISLSGVYSISCKGVNVPFINLSTTVSGGDYAVPASSLVGFLGQEDDRYLDGSLNLEIHYGKNEVTDVTVFLKLTDHNEVIETERYAGEVIPTFAYQSISWDQSKTYWEVCGYDAIKEYFDVGFTYLYDERFHTKAKATSLSEGQLLELENARKLGKKVMLDDDLLTAFARQWVSLIGNDIQVEDVTYHFDSEEELDAFLLNRLRMYMNQEALYGISVVDEPHHGQLLGGTKDLVPSLRRCLKKLGREDLFLNVNLLPFYCWREAIAGKNAVPDNQPANYHEYVRAYQSATGLDYVSNDIYPIKNEIHDHESQNVFYFANLEYTRRFADEYGLKMFQVAQTNSIDTSKGSGLPVRLMNFQDIRFLVNSLLAYSVDKIGFFTYNALDYSCETEKWIDSDSFLKRLDGSKTTMYYYVQSLIKNIDYLSPVLKSFTFAYARFLKKEGSNEVYEQINIAQKHQSYVGDPDILDITSSVSSLLITKSVRGDKSLYCIENIHNDEKQNELSEVTLTFARNVRYLEVYQAGTRRIVSTASFLLSSGAALFVIPH